MNLLDANMGKVGMGPSYYVKYLSFYVSYYFVIGLMINKRYYQGESTGKSYNFLMLRLKTRLGVCPYNFQLKFLIRLYY